MARPLGAKKLMAQIAELQALVTEMRDARLNLNARINDLLADNKTLSERCAQLEATLEEGQKKGERVQQTFDAYLAQRERLEAEAAVWKSAFESLMVLAVAK